MEHMYMTTTIQLSDCVHYGQENRALNKTNIRWWVNAKLKENNGIGLCDFYLLDMWTNVCNCVIFSGCCGMGNDDFRIYLR